MRTLDVRIAINTRGVARVQALGRNGADREQALNFITRILPQLSAIDAAAQLRTPETNEGK
jgi:hypothetical protein